MVVEMDQKLVDERAGVWVVLSGNARVDLSVVWKAF